jgi:hypothetical protein
MRYNQMSSNGLRALHNGIISALAEDDAQPPHRKLYGVREYPDWRHHADRIEAALAARGEWIVQVRW